MGKHKHYDVIVAWAEGKEIECRQVLSETDSRFTDWGAVASKSPAWDATEYRIKPEVKYPETRMSAEEIDKVYCESQETGWRPAFVAIANAAIRRAIEDGDVILPTKE